MIETTIILEKYLYIMGLALSLSTISIIYGLYYLFNLIYVMKTSTKVKKAQSYLLSAFMYLLIIPLFLIIISHNLLVRLFAVSSEPRFVEKTILIRGTEVIHSTDPFSIYFVILLFLTIIYWLIRYFRTYFSKKRKS